jgi:hypothetical protein
MTITVDTLPTPPGEPQWCSGHYEPSTREAFHQHSFEQTWGLFDERIRLGLTRFDSDGRAGAARVEIQYLADFSEVQGSVTLPDCEAGEFAGAFLYAIAMKKSAGISLPALFLRCAYEAGRAFLAAVRISRAASSRTASSHRRSIRPM